MVEKTREEVKRCRECGRPVLPTRNQEEDIWIKSDSNTLICAKCYLRELFNKVK